MRDEGLRFVVEVLRLWFRERFDCWVFVICGLWRVVCGVWFVVRGSWFVACGLWFLVCGLWFVVLGFMLRMHN